MKFQSIIELIIFAFVLPLLPLNKLTAQCQSSEEWGSAVAPVDNSTSIIADCNYAGEYGIIENIAMGNIYVISSSVCSDYITIYDENDNLVEHGNAPVAFFAMSSGDYEAHFSTGEDCTTENICRETSVNCITCGAIPGCTDPNADNYDPNADFGQCNCTYSGPQHDDCASAIDLTGYINADGTCTTVHLSDYTGATNSAGEINPSLACTGGESNPKDVWFKVDVPDHGAFTFDFISTPGFSSVMELYIGNCGDLIPYEPVNCINTASRSFEGLENGSTVYLRVWDFGSDDDGEHEICIRRTPYCTSWTAPSGSNVPVDIDFSWTAVEGAVGYVISIGSFPGGDDILGITNLGDVLLYDPGILLESATYYVSVLAYNNLGYSYTCQEFSFTTACGALTIDAAISDVLCFGDSNGAIDVSVSNGSGDYTYAWNGSGGFESEEQNIDGLIAGIYSLTVTDEENNCIGNTFFVVDSNDAIESDFTAFDETCSEGGGIAVSISGGAGDYDFIWSNGMESQDLNGVPAGLYSLTITDQVGCEHVLEDIEIQATGLEVNIENIQAVGCAISTGSISLSPENGNGPFDYYWISSDGLYTGSNMAVENAYTIEELPAGVYEVLITDVEGCEAILYDLEVSASQELLLSYNKTDIDCYNEQSGTITTVIDNGVPPYQVLSSNGVMANISTETFELTGLTGGNYGVTVTDAVGCVGISNNMVIDEPDPLNISVESMTYLTCFGEEDGQIDISVAGGNGSYVFQWNNGSATEDLNEILPGFYQVTVTDANHCTVVSPELEITAPDPIALVVEGIQHISCYGENNGTIFTNIIGGTAPYGISWNNGSIGENLAGLSEGVYQATITDFHGCTTLSPEIEISGPDEGLELNMEEQVDISCFGAQDGYIDLNISGGALPYHFNWSNGADTEDLSGLSTGNYLLTLTDANGCTLISPVFFIDEPAELTYSVSSTPELQGQANGTATIEIAGGTPPYTILWDSNAGAQDTETASGLVAGTYSVFVVDAKGCEFFTEIEVDLEISTGNNLLELAKFVDLYPNPTAAFSKLEIELYEQVEVKLEVLDIQGRLVDEFFDGGTVMSFNIDLSAHPEGVYLLRLLIDRQTLIYKRLIKSDD